MDTEVLRMIFHEEAVLVRDPEPGDVLVKEQGESQVQDQKQAAPLYSPSPFPFCGNIENKLQI